MRRRSYGGVHMISFSFPKCLIFTYITALVKTNTCLLWGKRLIVYCPCTLYSISNEKFGLSTRSYSVWFQINRKKGKYNLISVHPTEFFFCFLPDFHAISILSSSINNGSFHVILVKYKVVILI